MATAAPSTLALWPGSRAAASYYTAAFLADADVDTMREAAVQVARSAREHVALDWACLASPVELVNTLTLVYSTHSAVEVLYITVSKPAAGCNVDVVDDDEDEDAVAAAATGYPPAAASLLPATRFQNLVYDGQDVHWSVVGTRIHAMLRDDAFWAAASTTYKMNRLGTVKERPALPAVRIASIAAPRRAAGGTPPPRLSKKAMKRLQPARVRDDLAELARPTWRPPPSPPPSLMPDFHDAGRARWV